jgi:hypothetical protein
VILAIDDDEIGALGKGAIDHDAAFTEDADGGAARVVGLRIACDGVVGTGHATAVSSGARGRTDSADEGLNAFDGAAAVEFIRDRKTADLHAHDVGAREQSGIGSGELPNLSEDGLRRSNHDAVDSAIE